jgi:hypothetical protein
MTQPQPTQPLDLDAVQGRHAMYVAIHSKSGEFAHCAAQAAAEDIPDLITEVTRLRIALVTVRAAGYRQAADQAAEMVRLRGADADAEMLLLGLRRGAELREQFARDQGAPAARVAALLDAATEMDRLADTRYDTPTRVAIREAATTVRNLA